MQDSGWQAQGEQLHEPQAAGVSVFYTHSQDEARRVSVHYLPVGLMSEAEYKQAVSAARAAFRAIPDGPDSEAVAELGESRQFTVRQPAQDGREFVVTGTSFDLLYRHQGERFVAAQALLWTNLYVVQWLMVAPADTVSRDGLRRELERWAARMVLQTGVVSTGRCWLPMKIELAGRGKRRLRDQLATIVVKGDGIVRVMPDRLLVPESIVGLPDLESAALMYVGMGLAGRLIHGCVSPVDMNLDVPEGQREIRLEFSAPAHDRDTIPTYRLRSRRSAVG